MIFFGLIPSFLLGAYLSERTTMQSNSQLSSSPFRSKIITKQLAEFIVLILCVISRGNDQSLRGKSKQELEYYWENLVEDFTPETTKA